MPDPDVEARLAALESRVAELSEQAQAAADDRDVDEVRREVQAFRQAATSSFNAMREDLTDLRGEARDGFTEMRGKLDQAAAGQDHIVRLLTTLIGRPDADEN